MVNTTASAATSSPDDQERLRSSNYFSDDTDLSIDNILTDLTAHDSDDQLFLFQSAGSRSSPAAVEFDLDDDDRTTASDMSAMTMEEDDNNMEVHMLSTSMRDITFDPVDQCDGLDTSMTSRNSLYLDSNDFGSDSSANASRASETTSGSPDRPRRRISLNDLADFDTPCFVDADAQLHRHTNDGVSLCSFNTAETSQVVPALLNNTNCASPHVNVKHDEPVCYHSALESLVKTMERTQQSRQQVVYQRSLLTPQQRAELEEARYRQLQVQAIQTEALIPVQTSTQTKEICPTKSSILNAFFAGSRPSLLGAVEQSRRQLRNYMGQVQNQTL